jgi:15-cis-phytoene synthase
VIDPVVLASSRAVLAEKARSFRLAATFLPPDRHDDAALVYAFCRAVDDAADDAPDVASACTALDAIEAELAGAAPAGPLIAAFLEVAERRAMDLGCAFELIQGVRSDLEPVRVADDAELLRYCYRVASTVGLMMCAVLGVDDPVAQPFAIDLGVGMQLTNICRDVAEDARMGRVYLPATRLAYHGASAAELLAGDADRVAVARVVSDLLDLADTYYTSADEGMRYIPARSRMAIVVAAKVYRAIGVTLRKRGCDALAGRAFVPRIEKAGWTLRALGHMARPHLIGLTPPARHDRALHSALAGMPGASDPEL